MEIEVEEYVRTKNGLIDKVQNYSFSQKILHCENGMRIDECNCIGTYLEDIVKHSKNIIDLIEVGDIIEINNEKYEVIYDESLSKLGVLIPNRDYLAIRHSALEHIFKKYENIKILTKELYNANCYTATVERKE